MYAEVIALGEQAAAEDADLAALAAGAVAEAVEITGGDVQAVNPEGLEEGTTLQGE